MTPRPLPAADHNWWHQPALVLAVCGLVALFLTLLVPGSSFVRTLLTTATTGLSVLAVTRAATAWLHPSPRLLPYLYFLSALIGAVLGVAVNLLLRAHEGELATLLRRYPDIVARTFGVLVIIAGVVSALFLARDRNRRMEMAYHAERAKNAEQEKMLVETQLKMLQAQIEPHFLFNTLANVQSLIDLSPPEAKRMLGHFNDYLRASLTRSRDAHGTVAQEVQLLSAYLSILQIRMGERLRFAIDCPPELETLELAPMLLQPLVENAVRHGLEPKVEGGTVSVAFRRAGERLSIRVSDDGLGLGASSGDGVGLANVRARLLTLYGDDARFTLEACDGVTVTLEIPLRP
ncbi:sensor histidine kinase [Chitinimonas lacunae]|uniref:Sensor histidine kinase n=1 Tax=Chitinimonas lacunae TaxID=1963018 RepID=A0ABV8MUA9_9NEIS